MKWLKTNAANLITSSRIVASIIMITMPTLSKGFYVSYTYAGVSDAADGFLARHTGTVSTLGVKLDSIADLLFYVSMMIKILPYLIAYLPAYIMHTLYTIVGVRICIYIYYALTRHKFLSNHTVFNKATGIMLFFVPFLIKTPYLKIYAIIVLALSIFAAVYELYLVSNEEN